MKCQIILSKYKYSPGSCTTEREGFPSHQQPSTPSYFRPLRMTSFREQPLLSPFKNSAKWTLHYKDLPNTIWKWKMKIKYSGLLGMQLQITAMIDTVQCPKDKHNFSLTLGARGIYRLYIHKPGLHRVMQEKGLCYLVLHPFSSSPLIMFPDTRFVHKIVGIFQKQRGSWCS